MARTAVPIVSYNGSLTGVVLAATAAGDVTNGNVVNGIGSTTCLEVENSGGAEYDVTLVTDATVGGRAVPDDVTPLAASEKRVFGPFDTRIYGPNLKFNVENVAVKVRAFQVVPQ